MTTKWKIVTGFSLMVLLTGAVIFIGYSALQRNSDGFMEYRRLSMLNTGTSDMEAIVNKTIGDIYLYLNTKDPKHVEDAKNNAQRYDDLVDSLYQYVVLDARRELLQSLQEDIEQFAKGTDDVLADVSAANDRYRNVVLKVLWKMIDHLDAMSDRAEAEGSVQVLRGVNKFWKALVPVMSGLGRFGSTYDVKDGTVVDGYFASLEQELQALGRIMRTEQDKREFTVLQSYLTEISSAYRGMRASVDALHKSLERLNGVSAVAMKKTADESGVLNRSMLDYGDRTLANNSSTQNSMLLTGLGGMVTGVAVAFFIALGLIRVLRQLAAYAHAVSRGDFSHRITVREKGEVGSMIEAMRQIPAVLEELIALTNDKADKVRRGFLREQTDTARFSGAFVLLGESVNTVSRAYVDLLDVIPLPVMACDKSHNILYLNKAGESAIGKGGGGRACAEALNAKECSSHNCLGKRAMESRGLVSVETTVYPQGKRMEAAVTAVPTFDAGGAPCGYIEMIMDLTEIKDKQEVMRKVAQEASSISDRVAAAAEELAAQVEQISRGAEIQRTRVESTASAMSEMNSTVIEVARNASQASEQSESTRDRAEGGAVLVNRVVSAINKINEVGNNLQNNMRELGDKAESVGGVMNVISDIADQTNLLALNAAIEAARAGEAGRGFAVVADEVRKLAEKTMAATHEVGANITAIQQSTRVNIEEVGLAVNGVAEATSLANQSGDALQEIVNLAAVNSGVVASIATAAEEQSATSEEINRSIEEINRITGETTDGMVQSSAAVQDLSHMAQELRRVMEGLR